MKDTPTQQAAILRDFLWHTRMFDKLSHNDHITLSNFIEAAATQRAIEQLEAHAAVTSGVLDPEKCMKLLAADYIDRKKQLQSKLTQTPGGN